MFTFVVCLVVVGGAIVGVLALVPRGDEHKPATGADRIGRQDGSRTRNGGAVLRLPRRPPAARARAAGAGAGIATTTAIVAPRPEPQGFWYRLRSAAALFTVLAVIGVALALLIGAGLFALNSLLRHAAGNGDALGALF